MMTTEIGKILAAIEQLEAVTARYHALGLDTRTIEHLLREIREYAEKLK